MARRGKFGRLPRNAPDLTGALVALIREAASQVDQNMVDAWQNGGEVDGDPVTDARLLEFFKMRRDQLSTDDPLWDEWDNRVQQYTYSIDESKMMVKWENEKMTEGQVSKFYKDWMAKTPVNTEFYRELARNAGKWQAAARAKARSGRARGSSNAKAQWEENYFNKHVLPAANLDAALVQLAKNYGVMEQSGDDLSDLDTTAAKYGEFLDILDGNVPNDPNFALLIAPVVETIRKTHPDFEWSKTDIRDVLDAGKKGAEVLEETTESKGNKTAYRKYGDGFSFTNSRIDDLDEIERSFIATESFDKRMAACSGEPRCERNAMEILRGNLQTQMNTLAKSGILALDTSITGPLQQTIDNATAYIDGKTVTEQETSWDLFDLQGKMVPGAARTSSWFTGHGDRMWQSNDRLETGGWVSYVEGLDAFGKPKTSMVVHDASEQPPVNAIEVQGAGQFITRGGERIPIKAWATPTTVYGESADQQTGTTLSQPIPLYDAVTTMDFSTGRSLKYFRVKDPQTGKFVYTLDEPQFTNGEKKTAMDGKTSTIIFPPVVVPGEKGKNDTVIITPESEGKYSIESLTSLNKDGKTYVQGTYQTGTGALAAAAIEDAYTTRSLGPYMAEVESRTAINNLRTASEAAAKAGDTQTAAALNADYLAASQTAKLYREGKFGAVLDESYAALHDRTDEQARQDARLRANGVTPQSLGGQAEYDARVTLLSKWDEKRREFGIYDTTHPGGGNFDIKPLSGPGMREQFGEAERDIFNTSKPSNSINIPGIVNGQNLLRVIAPGSQDAPTPFGWLAGIANLFAGDERTTVPIAPTASGHPTTRTTTPSKPPVYPSYTPPGPVQPGATTTWTPPVKTTPEFDVPHQVEPLDEEGKDDVYTPPGWPLGNQLGAGGGGGGRKRA